MLSEAAILSTCNRVEVYLAGAADAVPEVDALAGALIDFHGVAAEAISGLTLTALAASRRKTPANTARRRRITRSGSLSSW